MKIQKILSNHDNKFEAIFVCEHCGETKKDTGTNDPYFFEYVLPLMKCNRCGMAEIRSYDKEIIPSEDNDIYNVDEWKSLVDNGIFIPDDGSGYWVKDNKRSTDEVFSTPQLDATHVIWFNK